MYLTRILAALALVSCKACDDCILDDPGMKGPPSNEKAKELFSICACEKTCDAQMMQEIVDAYFMEPASPEQDWYWEQAKGRFEQKSPIKTVSCLACIDRNDRRISCPRNGTVPHESPHVPLIREVCTESKGCYMMCYKNCRGKAGAQLEVESSSGASGGSILTIILGLVAICIFCCCMNQIYKDPEKCKDRIFSVQLACLACTNRLCPK